ncbi:hypothetical protein AX768_03690 [Burkholderia sp. PAMC 28687]|uniref:DUF3987 domain-containing protein n=1 Tax=Burkholderia sp. PAMC 28687 TaxID=1795874 RepID=UPI0007849D87|nr:DUF3987 domain-containing protein [Burkholderia sp. PAMC 28687]AMM13346.1 hypothetical protein AX768_03690 [Burkholderia sp. PAMC 28687]
MSEVINIEAEFASALSHAGFSPAEIVGDGQVHRFDGPDEKRGKRSAWYILFADGIGVGVFGDWRTGLRDTWCAKVESSLTDAERSENRVRIAKARALEARIRTERADEAQRIVTAHWAEAYPIRADHAYVVRKKIAPAGAKQRFAAIMVPLRDADGVLRSAQYIQPDGKKTFKSGGIVAGSFCTVGAGLNPSTPLLVCEGWATACTLRQATGYPVAAAMSAGNLMAVCTALREKYPGRSIIVCGDDDFTPGNPGRTAAQAAALAINGAVAQPTFSKRTNDDTDFNDMAAKEGLAAVKAAIENAQLTAAVEAGKATPDWPAPEPLPNSLRPVADFDMRLLPESLCRWAEDIANRVQCPPDFIGATIIGVLGTIIGRRVGVRPKSRDDWTEYANQWVCIVGRPGVMKSPAMSAVLAPLKRLDYDASMQFENELALFEAEAKIHKMRQDAGEKKAMAALKKNPDAHVSLPETDELDPPKHHRYLVNDATVEKLGEICADNPQGIGVFRDELVSLLKSLERDGQESARGFYLTAWNGNESYIVDRIMRGHQRIEAVCLSVIGSTQPGRLSEYLRGAIGGGAADDGLMQRFGVLVWPDVPRQAWENVDCWPDAEAKHSAYAVFEKLDVADPIETWKAELPTGPDGQHDGNPPFLRLDAEALELFVEWRTEHENELRGGDLHPAMESHLAKYRKLVPSLALVLHLADDGIGNISAQAMTRALAWAAYLRSHAERAYGSVLLAEVSGAKALLKRIVVGDIEDAFTARDVYRNQWSGLENREATAKAISVLVEYGYLRTEAVDTGGRSKSLYRIYPELRS